METKAFWRSKTFWVNTLTLLAALIPPVQDFLVTSFALSPEILISILAGVNLVLRFISGTQLEGGANT